MYYQPHVPRLCVSLGLLAHIVSGSRVAPYARIILVQVLLYALCIHVLEGWEQFQGKEARVNIRMIMVICMIWVYRSRVR